MCVKCFHIVYLFLSNPCTPSTLSKEAFVYFVCPTEITQPPFAWKYYLLFSYSFFLSLIVCVCHDRVSSICLAGSLALSLSLSLVLSLSPCSPVRSLALSFDLHPVCLSFFPCLITNTCTPFLSVYMSLPRTRSIVFFLFLRLTLSLRLSLV